MAKKKFERISKRDWTNQYGETFVYISAAYFESDKVGDIGEGDDKAVLYKGEFELPNSERTEIELLIKKSPDKFGKVKVNGKDYTIWKNSNDRGSWNSFRIDDIFYNVKEKVDKNGNFYYVISYRLPKEEVEDMSENTDNEAEFDI